MNTHRICLTAVVTAVAWAAVSSHAAGNLVLRLANDTDQVMVPNSETLTFANRFTWEAWIRMDDTQPAGGAVITKGRSAGLSAIRLAVSDSVPELGVNNGVDFNLNIPSPSAISLLEWHHLAATYDGLVFKLYVNGELASFHTYETTLPVGDTPLRIGSDDPEITWIPGFLGMIDDVRLWSRALSQAEIQGQMYMSLSGLEPGLVGYWNFNDGTAQDFSLRGNHGEFMAGAMADPGPEIAVEISRAVEIVIPATLPTGMVQVQYSTTITLPVWIDLGDPVETQGQPFSIFDSVRGSERRFYRIVSQ